MKFIMDKEEFFSKLSSDSLNINIHLNDIQMEQFYQYMKLLLEWNQQINLTAITEENEIIKKHFIDSITISKYIEKDSKVIDIGSGAGFPGIPLKIAEETYNITLIDALNKRLKFLNEVIGTINLKNIQTIHTRAEDIGKNIVYRETFDVAVSRAVASLNVLVEYLLPLVKVGGKCICMKGNNVKIEIEEAKKAIELLGGKIEQIEEFNLPNSDITRSIIIIKKIKNTPNKYPRKAGIPSKDPIHV